MPRARPPAPARARAAFAAALPWTLGALLLAGGAARAQDAGGAPLLARLAKQPAEEVWTTVSNHTLDSLRGGFDLGDGLLVTFGISRAVSVNGTLVAQTTLDFGNLSALTPVQAAQLGQQLASLHLVQIGPGNIAPTGPGNYGTVIQNTLNNQHIAAETVINATTNAAGILKNLNLNATLLDGLSAAVPH